MLTFHLTLAAISLPKFIYGSPVTKIPFLYQRSGSAYTVYSGDGSISEGWPAMSNWVSDFDTMFNNNKPIIQSSCSQWDVPNNSDEETSTISTSIQSVAKSTGIDSRFILAILMEESNGCVRAPTTNGGVRNPGLMQSHDGIGTCNDATVQNPCPSSEIIQMIQDGTSGTSSGDGLKQCLAETGASDVSMYYKAARIYNSGSIDKSGNLGLGLATHCYASNIANRLTGWSSGSSGCDGGTVGDFNGSPASSTGSSVTISTSESSTLTSSGLPASSTTALQGGVFATTSPTPEPSATFGSPAAGTVAATPLSTGTSSYPITPGTYCTVEGMWNCIDGISFQRCASGTWSVVEQLAAGTNCTLGRSVHIDLEVIYGSKRSIRLSQLSDQVMGSGNQWWN